MAPAGYRDGSLFRFPSPGAGARSGRTAGVRTVSGGAATASSRSVRESGAAWRGRAHRRAAGHRRGRGSLGVSGIARR